MSECPKCKKLVEALKFYADPTNWREHNPSNRPAGMTYKQRITSRDSSHIGPNQYDFGGGKKAREAISDYERFKK